MSALFRRSPSRAADDEIRHHLEERIDALVAEGWDADEARREAERRFGDVAHIRAELMDLDRREEGKMTTGELVRSLAADVAYALRSLKASPTFTAAVVATLALGIGATASIFAVLDAMLLRPLPFDDAERWVEVNQARKEGAYSFGLASARVPAWQEAADGLLDGWVAYARDNLVRTDGDQAERLSVLAVTPGAEGLLGIPLLLGRGITANDALPGAPPVVVLARSYWERTGADPAILGRTLRLESGPVTVVGVLAGDRKFPQMGDPPDLWLPLRNDFTFADRDVPGVQGLWARIPPDAALATVQERVDALAEGLMASQPAEGTWQVRLVPIDAHRGNPDVRRALWILAATVGTLLLIALVNGVNLLLVRTSVRWHELAVRTALGASRGRLLRQLTVEGLVLGVLAGAAAVGLAWGAVATMRGILPTELAYFSPHAFDVEGRTLAFAFLASLGAGLVLGLLLALQVLRHRAPARSLAGRAGSDDVAGRRLREGLVVTQIALSMALLVGAGLLVNGFVRLLSVEPGFDVERVAVADLMISPTRYADAEARADFGRRLEAALEARPEVEGVTLTSGGGISFGAALEAEDWPVPEGQPTLIPNSQVAEDYFRTLGMPLVEGRPLQAGDRELGGTVVDRDLARFLWGGEPAVGRRFRLGEDGEWMTVVGVVEELILMGRDQRQGPYQYVTPKDPERAGTYLEVAMRTAGPPEALLGTFQRTLRELDPEQSYWRLRTAAQTLAEEEQKPRFLVTLMGLLAGVGVTLAAVGLWGVLAYSVSRRRRELGIRMALGAARQRVRRMVVLEGLRVAAAGVLLGLLGAYWASQLFGQLLYEVDARDPTTFAATALLFVGIAVAASLLPARRATSVDPVEVLRAE